MTGNYEKIAGIVSHIRNARFGEMVGYSEELIESGDWREFETPVGTKFRFEACEYDYFLAAEEVDATTLKAAYETAAPHEKVMRLADITGKGKTPDNGDRRSRDEVADLYASEPSGAGARIKAWADASVVSHNTARLARDPEQRKAIDRGEKVLREKRSLWRVRWSDDRPAAEVIVAKLLEDPDLAHEVYKGLEAERVRTRRADKRRSEG